MTHRKTLTKPFPLEHLDIVVGHLWVLGPQGRGGLVVESRQESPPPFPQCPGVVRLRSATSSLLKPLSGKSVCTYPAASIRRGRTSGWHKTHPNVRDTIHDHRVFRSDPDRVDNVADSRQETSREDPFPDEVDFSLVWHQRGSSREYPKLTIFEPRLGNGDDLNTCRSLFVQRRIDHAEIARNEVLSVRSA